MIKFWIKKKQNHMSHWIFDSMAYTSDGRLKSSAHSNRVNPYTEWALCKLKNKSARAMIQTTKLTSGPVQVRHRLTNRVDQVWVKSIKLHILSSPHPNSHPCPKDNLHQLLAHYRPPIGSLNED